MIHPAHLHPHFCHGTCEKLLRPPLPLQLARLPGIVSSVWQGFQEKLDTRVTMCQAESFVGEGTHWAGSRTPFPSPYSASLCDLSLGRLDTLLLWRSITKSAGRELKEGSWSKSSRYRGEVEVAPRLYLASQEPAGVCGKLSNSVPCHKLYYVRTKMTSAHGLVENTCVGWRWEGEW